MNVYWIMIILNNEAAAVVKISGSPSAKSASEPLRRAFSEEPAAAIDAVSYLAAIAGEIISGRSRTGKILLRADGRSRFMLPLDKAIPLGLIVSELVTNSVKYAHPTGVTGIIRIESSRHNGAMVIEISDDGVGLPEGLDPLANADAGLAMVRTLAAQLGASISFDNHGLGLSCILRVPYAEAAQ
jgi:two-component sensor histidine kinase